MRCFLGVAQALLPSSKPVRLDRIANCCRQVLLHLPLEAYSRGKHVAVLGDMAGLFASHALYSREVWTSALVRPGKASTAGGGACAAVTIMILTMPNVAIACSWTVAPEVSAAAGATMSVAGVTGRILVLEAWVVVTAKPVDARNVLN